MDTTGLARRAVKAQALVALLSGIGAGLFFGLPFGLGAAYGGATALLATLLLARSVRRAEDVARTDPKRGMTVLYVGAVLRFVFVIAMFAIGPWLLKLDPRAVGVGFAATWLTQFIINARGMTRDTEGDSQ